MKSTKKRYARAKLSFCQSNPNAFFAVLVIVVAIDFRHSTGYAFVE